MTFMQVFPGDGILEINFNNRSKNIHHSKKDKGSILKQKLSNLIAFKQRTKMV